MSGIFVPKIVKNPLILLKVTIDNVGVPFLRHSVDLSDCEKERPHYGIDKYEYEYKHS